MLQTDASRIRFLLEADAELAALFVEESLAVEAREAVDRPKYVTNYIGSKQKLVDWIWASTPDEVSTAVDAFSGSSVVAYMYKAKGLAVHAVDRLAYCHHIARAIVENDGTTLSDEEIDSLLAANAKASDFVRRHFKGIYFEPGVHRVIDTIRSNIDAQGLSGFKRDIALFALGKTCITGKGGFGHFGTTQRQEGRADSPAEFRDRFAANCRRINELVFKGERPCKAHHGDARKVLAGVKADVAYFDPPYATHFSQTNYERAYHFVEGLMTYWEGKEIQADTKTRQYAIPTEVTQTNAKGFFEEFLGAAAHIPFWIISYRDQAYPSEAEIKKIVAAAGKVSRMKTKEHRYSISAKHGENSVAKERLFVCTPAEGSKAAADALVDETLLADAAPDGDPDTDGGMQFAAFSGSLTMDYDPDLLEALAAPNKGPKDADAVRVSAFMGNKYFILDFLWRQTPKDVKSVLDAFSGGANVAYFYKQKGLRVVANDKLNYPHTIARALIENNTVTLTDEEVEGLFANAAGAAGFCEEHFYGYYFTKPILRFLDQAWANAQKLKGYKRDLALTALGWTVVNKAKFGEFTRSKKALTGPVAGADTARQTSLSNIPLGDFTGRFRTNLARVNKLVLDNGQANKATQTDAVTAVRGTDCELVYADPPYITHFGNNDYEAKLHFVEGLMTMWKGKELRDNTRRDYASATKYTRETIEQLIADIVAGAGGKHLLLSYRDKAYPDEATIRGFFKERFKRARVTGVDVQYAMITNDPKSGGKYARELVFVGSEPKRAAGGSRSKAARTEPGIEPIHTRITGDVVPESLSADAARTGEKRFTFVLTHVGTNRNGDHFTPEELRAAAETAIGKKIDLSHSQEFRDIVGGIVESRYVDAGDDSRVECVGELFTEESEPARLAHKLMHREIVSHVSMECDYVEGECSFCGKRIKSKAEYCIHLKNYKGRSYQGKPVFEILHGITFTGMGLLDREGADERAEIKRVAEKESGSLEVRESGSMSGQAGRTGPSGLSDSQTSRLRTTERSEPMADDNTKHQRAAEGPTDPSELSDADKDKLIREQQGEIERLQKELDAAQKKLEESQAAHRSVVRKTKAEKLLATWEEAGREFEGDEGRTAEMDRLLKLTDEAFAATEAAVETFAAGKKKRPEDEEDEESDEDGDEPPEDGKKPPFPPRKKKRKKGVDAMGANSSRRPAASHDTHATLEAELTQGFMAAYEDRLND